MFTGIVSAVGTIVALQALQRGRRATIDAGGLDLSDVNLGDSIAVSGACLTVVSKTEQTFSVDISEETLRCTAGLDRIGQGVNLERALRLSDRLDGHLVTGHIDGVGTVTHFEPIGESWELAIAVPADLSKYLAPKGSITVDGVSLTINRVDKMSFTVNIIPHTYTITNFKRLRCGKRVNLEADLIARYVERVLATSDTVRGI